MSVENAGNTMRAVVSWDRYSELISLIEAVGSSTSITQAD